jgi:hypothetical protein
MKTIRLLLAKDLRILGRSPALLAALILYPLVFAVLVGLVVRYASDQPRVAFVDLDRLPETLTVGGQRFDVEDVISQVQGSVELVPMEEEEADHQLATGGVVAEIVVPPGFASKLRGMVESPQLVLRTAQGGLSGRVEQQTQALVYALNQRLQEAYIAANLEYVDLLLEGGEGSFLGNEFDIVGLREAEVILAEIERTSDDPEVVERARELGTFVSEAQLALGAAGDSLRATANPIELEVDADAGRTWLLSAQLQAYALGLTLAFICVLLAAAALAAERDENVIGRLARGLVRLSDLVVVKVLLAALVAVGLGFVIALLVGVRRGPGPRRRRLRRFRHARRSRCAGLAHGRARRLPRRAAARPRRPRSGGRRAGCLVGCTRLPVQALGGLLRGGSLRHRPLDDASRQGRLAARIGARLWRGGPLGRAKIAGVIVHDHTWGRVSGNREVSRECLRAKRAVSEEEGARGGTRFPRGSSPEASDV